MSGDARDVNDAELGVDVVGEGCSGDVNENGIFVILSDVSYSEIVSQDQAHDKEEDLLLSLGSLSTSVSIMSPPTSSSKEEE